jgi:hypothetical protein
MLMIDGVDDEALAALYLCTYAKYPVYVDP